MPIKQSSKSQVGDDDTETAVVVLSADDRQILTNRVVRLIDEAMKNGPEMRREAIVEGRIGLEEMNDGELVALATECWGLDISSVIVGAQA